MPATGLVAPLLALVTVRAMVPVAGMPPKNGVTKLATPWAISSWLGLWRSPIMPSATRAHSSDSIAPSKARVRVGMTKAWALAQLNSGHTQLGRLEGMPPKRLPMVSNGKPHQAVSAVANTSTTMEPGKLATPRTHGEGAWTRRRPPACQTNNTSTPALAMPNAQGLNAPRFCPKVCKMPQKSAGMLGTFSPKKSLICDKATNTAMPLVKPITTATGMNRIRLPSLSRPMANNSTPDMAVAKIRLATPWRSTMP